MLGSQRFGGKNGLTPPACLNLSHFEKLGYLNGFKSYQRIHIKKLQPGTRKLRCQIPPMEKFPVPSWSKTVDPKTPRPIQSRDGPKIVQKMFFGPFLSQIGLAIFGSTVLKQLWTEYFYMRGFQIKKSLDHERKVPAVGWNFEVIITTRGFAVKKAQPEDKFICIVLRTGRTK